MVDFDTISPADFGRSLRGLGINLLVKDVKWHAEFLADVFDAKLHRVSSDFAIADYHGQIYQLHADSTYSAHPLLGLLPEAGPRGAGVQIHLFETDPDQAVERARAYEGVTILAQAKEKPHSLREAFILCRDGYAWVPSKPLEA